MSNPVLPAQMPLSDPNTVGPFVGRFAQEVASQEAALHQGSDQNVIVRMRQTWGERNLKWIGLVLGAAGGLLLVKALRW